MPDQLHLGVAQRLADALRRHGLVSDPLHQRTALRRAFDDHRALAAAVQHRGRTAQIEARGGLVIAVAHEASCLQDRLHVAFEQNFRRGRQQRG